MVRAWGFVGFLGFAYSLLPFFRLVICNTRK